MTNLSTQVIRILTGYPPFKNPSWFNVGDKVRCINTTFTGREKINCIYTAIGKEINGGIIVKDKNGNIIDTIAECFALE